MLVWSITANSANVDGDSAVDRCCCESCSDQGYASTREVDINVDVTAGCSDCIESCDGRCADEGKSTREGDRSAQNRPGFRESESSTITDDNTIDAANTTEIEVNKLGCKLKNCSSGVERCLEVTVEAGAVVHDDCLGSSSLEGDGRSRHAGDRAADRDSRISTADVINIESCGACDSSTDGNLHIPSCSLRSFNMNSVFIVGHQVSSSVRGDCNGSSTSLVDVDACLLGSDVSSNGDVHTASCLRTS